MSYLIGITMRITNNDAYYEIRDSISNDYVKFINKYDIEPVLIPNTLVNPVEYFRKLNCKGLILTGGDDVLITYEEIICKEIEFQNNRDRTEYNLLHYCIENDIPVFGICRGMQLINLYFKGRIKKLNKEIKDSKHVNKIHKIKLINTEFYFMSDEIEVNSFHNNGVFVNSISKELDCFAVAEDNVVEGIYKKNKIIGVQWHPERSISLYDDFIMKKWLSWIEEDK